jgi:hypothetical protein
LYTCQCLLIVPLVFFNAFIGISVKMHVVFFYDSATKSREHIVLLLSICLFVHPHIGYMLCQPYSFQSRNFILQDICTYTKFKFLWFFLKYSSLMNLIHFCEISHICLICAEFFIQFSSYKFLSYVIFVHTPNVFILSEILNSFNFSWGHYMCLTVSCTANVPVTVWT